MTTDTGHGKRLDIGTVNRSKVARETGTDLAHISRIFNLKATPSLVLAVRIARVLEVTVDELCAGLGIDPEADLKTVAEARGTRNETDLD